MCKHARTHNTWKNTGSRKLRLARARASPAAMDTRAVCVQSWETGWSPITELDLIFECVCTRPWVCKCINVFKQLGCLLELDASQIWQIFPWFLTVPKESQLITVYLQFYSIHQWEFFRDKNTQIWQVETNGPVYFVARNGKGAHVELSICPLNRTLRWNGEDSWGGRWGLVNKNLQILAFNLNELMDWFLSSSLYSSFTVRRWKKDRFDKV